MVLITTEQPSRLKESASLVENVGAAPLLDVPNIVCYCYTTLSILLVYCVICSQLS